MFFLLSIWVSAWHLSVGTVASFTYATQDMPLGLAFAIAAQGKPSMCRTAYCVQWQQAPPGILTGYNRAEAQ